MSISSDATIATSKDNIRRVVILGSTGSIGQNTVNVIQHMNSSTDMTIEVVGLAAGRNIECLTEQAKLFPEAKLAIADQSLVEELSAKVPGREIFAGPDSSSELIKSASPTDVAAAVVGSAGLPATMLAIDQGVKRISLANKETLVAAGALFMPKIAESGTELIPVDSEHSAIFQCMNEKENARDQVERIVLTASGGPFRTASAETIQNATVEDALKHPTWKMGRKITIDSATMMNKALEVIEAHWLFDLPDSQIEVIVHPQSIIHSFVEFKDRSILAQLGAPDMRTPIQYALTYPERRPGNSTPLDWSSLTGLTFEPPNTQKFPAIRLAYEIIRTGGTSGAIFNAANEAAVEAFLNRQIKFGQIVELVERTLNDLTIEPISSLEVCWEADRKAREHVNHLLSQLKD